MKYLALILFIAGSISLYLFYSLSIPIDLKDYSKINRLEDNQKVNIKGKIMSQKIYEKNIMIKLNNNLSINCKKPCELNNKINKDIDALCSYDKFYNSFNLINFHYD